MPEHALASTTDPISQSIVAIVLIALFALLTLEKAHRVLVALGAVSLLWAITYLTPYHLISFEAAARALDLNVLLLLAGMMAVVAVLKATDVFDWAVGRLVLRAGGRPDRMLALLVWGTGIASAFLDNVTTVIFAAPIAVGTARQMGLAPRALILPVIMAANIGGAATLIGDPPNIMVGSGAGLSFVAFLENVAAPVLVMMVLLVPLCRRWFAADLASAQAGAVAAAPSRPIADPLLLRWMLAISAGILLGFLTHGVTGMPAAIPATIGAAAALIAQDMLYLRTHRPSAEERRHGILGVLEHEIEWPTLVFFAFLFIVVGAAVETGLIGSLARTLEGGILAGRDSLGLDTEATLFFAALLVLWTAGVLSALIDNIPFVAVSIPIVHDLIPALPGEATVLWWALALGACLGGNGTPIGASANVTTLDLAARAGVSVTFGAFTRFGAIVVLMSLLVATAWLAAWIWLGPMPALAGSLAVAALLAAGARALR